MLEEIKVIMKAKDIPDTATVTKKTGTFRYDLRRELRVDGKVITNLGCLFLFDQKKTNYISTIPGDLELLWITSPLRLRNWLEEHYELEQDYAGN